MDPLTRWKVIHSRARKLLPLDIEHCSPLTLRQIILDVRTPGAILERVAFAYYEDEDLMQGLVRCPNLSEETLAYIALTASDGIRDFIARTRVVKIIASDADNAQAGQEKKLNVQQIVNRMTTPQKIKLALSGGKDARTLLIRESNKQISTAVLENPRITEGEVAFFAQSQNLAEDVIRKIGANLEWSRKYTIVQSLVNNPKTPVGISLGFVTRMNDRDLGILERSRNIPEALRTAARNLVVKRKLGKK